MLHYECDVQTLISCIGESFGLDLPANQSSLTFPEFLMSFLFNY